MPGIRSCAPNARRHRRTWGIIKGVSDRQEGAFELGRLARDVLRLSEVPRTASDMAFLSGDESMTAAAVERCLAELERRSLVERREAARPLWVRTPGGSIELRRVEDWEVIVQDVFNISQGRQPIIVGTLTRGVMYVDDWFLVNGDGLGRVLTVEFVCGSDVPEDAISFTADRALVAGDVLTRHEPMAA